MFVIGIPEVAIHAILLVQLIELSRSQNKNIFKNTSIYEMSRSGSKPARFFFLLLPLYTNQATHKRVRLNLHNANS